MSERPIWRGQLRLALVSCPVALYSVRAPSQELHFHFINPKTGNRVRMVTLDAETDEELSRKDLVRGYEFKKDHYVILEDEDFENARIDSSSVLGIDKFVEAESIDPIYYDASYYLAPDGSGRDAADDVFVTLRDAIAKSGRVALSRIVIARRERAVAIMPMGKGLVLHTLHDAQEITAPGALFDDIADVRPDREMIGLATQLIDRQTQRFSPDDMEDRYEARLRAVIDAKIKGEKLAPEPEEEERDNVVDLMSALRRSLGEEPKKSGGTKGSGGKTGKSAKPAAARKAKPPAGAAAKKAPPRRKAG